MKLNITNCPQCGKDHPNAEVKLIRGQLTYMHPGTVHSVTVKAIDWGDGTVDNKVGHHYAKPGLKSVKVK